MTMQSHDTIIYKGESTWLIDWPLEGYLKGSNESIFKGWKSSCRRRYEATWEMIDGRLYLVDIEATLLDGTSATIQAIFPDAKDKVWAEWYTGELVLPDRTSEQYETMNWYYQRFDDVFQIENGIITGQRRKENKKPKPDEY